MWVRRTELRGLLKLGVYNIRIDAPEANGILPAHAKNVRLENIYGDRIYYHHIDIVSSKNVVVDGYSATRSGEGNSNAPIQFDNQTAGTTSNRIWEGDCSTLVATDGTPTRNGTLRNFTIDRVSCIDNARGISLGQAMDGRRELSISNVTIRTTDNDLASGSGLYASGFDGAEISNVSIEGSFTNTVVCDDMDDLKMSNVSARVAIDQAFCFRKNADATLTTVHAEDCGRAAIYPGTDSSIAYGGLTLDNVGTEVVIDGEIREWKMS